MAIVRPNAFPSPTPKWAATQTSLHHPSSFQSAVCGDVKARCIEIPSQPFWWLYTFVFMFSDCRCENLPKLPKLKAISKDSLKSWSPSFVVVLKLGMSGAISVMHGTFLSWNWSVIKVWLELPGIFLMGCQTHGKGWHVSLSNPLGRVHTHPPLRVLMYELYFSKLQLLDKF